MIFLSVRNADQECVDKMILIPKPYIQKLQNRKECNNLGDGSPHSSLCDCCGTGYEPITLIFPAKEAKDWKVGQEIEIETGKVYPSKFMPLILGTIKFKILSLERKKLDEDIAIQWCDLFGTKNFNDVEKLFGKIKDGEEIILVII